MGLLALPAGFVLHRVLLGGIEGLADGVDALEAFLAQEVHQGGRDLLEVVASTVAAREVDGVEHR